jgi:hypothetical protein
VQCSRRVAARCHARSSFGLHLRDLRSSHECARLGGKPLIASARGVDDRPRSIELHDGWCRRCWPTGHGPVRHVLRWRDETLYGAALPRLPRGLRRGCVPGLRIRNLRISQPMGADRGATSPAAVGQLADRRNLSRTAGPVAASELDSRERAAGRRGDRHGRLGLAAGEAEDGQTRHDRTTINKSTGLIDAKPTINPVDLPGHWQRGRPKTDKPDTTEPPSTNQPG